MEAIEVGKMALKLSETTVDANNGDGTPLFVFDNVFGPDSEQKDIFDAVGVPLVNDVIEGYNATIFAYDQTGAGKTHTMMGPLIGDEHLAGIIPRAVGLLFEGIAGANANIIKFVIKVSYVEIYMERIRDLLDPSRDNLAVRRSRKAVSSLPRPLHSTAQGARRGLGLFGVVFTRGRLRQGRGSDAPEIYMHAHTHTCAAPFFTHRH